MRAAGRPARGAGDVHPVAPQVTPAPVRLRVRAHVPAPTADARPPRRWWVSPAQPAAFVHVRPGDDGRAALATFRIARAAFEKDGGTGRLGLHTFSTCGEWIGACDERLPDVRTCLEERKLRPDVDPGLGGIPLKADPLARIGQEVTTACYRHTNRVPLIGWDLPATLGALAVAEGTSRRRRPRGGESAADDSSPGAAGRPGGRSGAGKWRWMLAGTVIRKKDGQPADSFDWPALYAASFGRGVAFGWGTPRHEAAHSRSKRRPRFIDLKRLAAALAGTDGFAHPSEAASVFGTSWPNETGDELADLRAEAAALCELAAALFRALELVAPGMDPSTVWTFGSISTHLLRTAGVRSPLARSAAVPLADLGAAASANFGGRAEARLVGVPIPATLVDITSTYPAVFSLLGLGGIFTAEHFETHTFAPDEIGRLRDLLADVAAGGQRIWTRTTWREQGLTFAVVRPRGEPLPCAAEFPTPGAPPESPGGWRTRVGPLDLTGGTACYYVADLLAAVCEDPAAAGIEIVRCFRFLPLGIPDSLRTAGGLHPVRLPSGRNVDPIRDDIGVALVGERSRLKAAARAGSAPEWKVRLTKAVSNALTYGVLARSDVHASPDVVEVVAVGPDGDTFPVRTNRPETPGPFAFLPGAAAVTAGCRLVVALFARELRSIGSWPVAIHTDSVTVPYRPEGGTVEVPGAPGGRLHYLSRAELDAIIARFDPLGIRWHREIDDSPDGGHPVVALALGVNKVIYGRRDREQPSGWEIVRSSDTGLGGHLLDPTGTDARLSDGHSAWARELEAFALASATGGEDGRGRGALLDLSPGAGLRELELPTWAEQTPVIRRRQATDRATLAALRADLGCETVPPFATFERIAAPGDCAPARLVVPGRPPGEWSAGGRPVIPERYVNGTFLPVAGPVAGVVGTAQIRTQRVVVDTVLDYFKGWLWDEDPTLTGPRRGLRTPVRVVSAPGLIVLTGKDATELEADHDPVARRRLSARAAEGARSPAGMRRTLGRQDAPDRLDYGTAGLDKLREQVRRVGVHRTARVAQIPYQTVQDFAAGGAGSPTTIQAVTTAHARIAGRPAPTPAECRWPECHELAMPRGAYCSARCRQRAHRAKRRPDASVAVWVSPRCACGAALAGALAITGVCPPCAEMTAKARGRPDGPAQTRPAAVVCAGCGIHLSGLAARGPTCPQCSHPLASTDVKERGTCPSP